uniref:Uncharacterized protein n=1 Tax=Arundo donax TaxID=35708 RepID=A0A0A9HJQ9_ARUDO
MPTIGSRMELLRPLRAGSCPGVAASAAPAISMARTPGSRYKNTRGYEADGGRWRWPGSQVIRLVARQAPCFAVLRSVAYCLGRREGTGRASYGGGWLWPMGEILVVSSSRLFSLCVTV